MTYEEALQKLSPAGQEHLLQYYGELAQEQKNRLLEQIEALDLSLLELVKDGVVEPSKGKLEPLGAVTLEQIRAKRAEYEHKGLEAVRSCNEGKIYMEDKDRMAASSNGNGGWFSSLARAGLLGRLQELGVEWLNVFSVDNVLQRIADPVFVGAVIDAGCVCGAKVVAKAGPDEKVGVLCLEDGKPSIVEYYEMTDENRNSRGQDGELLYNYGVILNYLFDIATLTRIMNENMPVHIVEKKIPYIDSNGKMVRPEEPNGYKFETLILDMIHMMENCLPFEVDRRKEFAPIKNRTGVDSLDSARELMKENGMEL